MADEMKKMLSQSIQDANMKLTDQKNGYDAKLEKVTEALAAAATEIATFKNRFLGKIEEGLDKMAKKMPAMNEALASDFTESTQQLFDRVDNSLDEIAQRYDQSGKMSSQLNETLQNLSGTQQALLDNLREIFWFRTDKEAMLNSREILKLETLYLRHKFRWIVRLFGKKQS